MNSTASRSWRLARLSGVSGLVPSVDWLLYSAIRKEALLTSQIEGTQAALAVLFEEEAGVAVSNTDDVEEVTNYLRAFRLVQDKLARSQRVANQPSAVVRRSSAASRWPVERAGQHPDRAPAPRARCAH
jgi:Fic family protein